MFTKKTKPVTDEHLDQVGKALVQALRQADTASEEALAPNAFGQLRNRIAQEKARREGSLSIWEAIVGLASQSLSTFGLVTACAVLLVWILPAQTMPVPAPSQSAVPPVEEQLVRLSPMQECTISTRPDCSVSPSEVLTIVVKPAR
ncbi:MAG TPA: hypothetical protein PLL06_13395 [Acidobacteriota bacterium]|nr:hypothetical protein [Acidobacteriota bacterium]